MGQRGMWYRMGRDRDFLLITEQGFLSITAWVLALWTVLCSACGVKGVMAGLQRTDPMAETEERLSFGLRCVGKGYTGI